MNMSSSKTFRFLILLSALVSIFIGFRFLDVGKDTEQYVLHFNNPSDKFEVGFRFLIHFFSKYISSVELFFSFIAFIITAMYLLFFKRIYQRNFSQESFTFDRMMLFFSLLLLSSWYITMTTNGLRQGVALVFLYYSLFELFYNNRKFKFLIVYLIALSFHNSVIIIAPFLLFKYLRFRLVFIFWILTACGYAFGVNELIIKLISEKYNLPVYSFIKLYSLERGVTEGGIYNGFSVNFFIYTIFWPFLLIFILKIKSRLKSSILVVNETLNLIKIYFTLSIPYFIFGFGPFSNRYAMLSWFLVPLLQFHIFNAFSFKNNIKVFSLILINLIILFFLFFRLQWIRIL
jgi:hypothetical protein